MNKEIEFFLARVDQFRAEFGFSESGFGHAVLNDRGFLMQVRSGKRVPGLRVIDKCRSYMDDHRASEAAK